MWSHSQALLYHWLYLTWILKLSPARPDQLLFLLPLLSVLSINTAACSFPSSFCCSSGSLRKTVQGHSVHHLGCWLLCRPRPTAGDEQQLSGLRFFLKLFPRSTRSSNCSAACHFWRFQPGRGYSFGGSKKNRRLQELTWAMFTCLTWSTHRCWNFWVQTEELKRGLAPLHLL